MFNLMFSNNILVVCILKKIHYNNLHDFQKWLVVSGAMGRVLVYSQLLAAS